MRVVAAILVVAAVAVIVCSVRMSAVHAAISRRPVCQTLPYHDSSC